MEDIEDRVDDEEVDEAPEEEAEASTTREEPAARPASPAEGGDVESIEELIVKKEERAAQEEEDDSVLSLTREERLEPLAVKVVPPQATEFVCKNCYLVKHRSQLKDKTRMLCRDCA
jgi:uncharacterized protein DUF4193